jgi:hypothetical protein
VPIAEHWFRSALFYGATSEPVSTKLVYASPISPAAQRQFSFSQKC